jgi:cytochrome b561
LLFIGIGMVSTLQPKFLTLIAIHRPMGIAILLLAIFRLGVRLRLGAPSLPADRPLWRATSAKASHYLLYALLIAMPLGRRVLEHGGAMVERVMQGRLPTTIQLTRPMQILP